MRRIFVSTTIAIAAVTLVIGGIFAGPPRSVAKEAKGLPEGIAFYGVLKDGLKEAKSTNRPILFLSAAPQCIGVPGMW